MGDDCLLVVAIRGIVLFLSTSPVWGTTPSSRATQTRQNRFLSTSPVWGTTATSIINIPNGINISIHVPRMGDDLTRGFFYGYISDFYPRPPYGGRLNIKIIILTKFHFYPRPPYGGRRPAGRHARRQRCDFYPRPPYGGRRLTATSLPPKSYFYPRPPYGGRPHIDTLLLCNKHISIHVPRMGDDINNSRYIIKIIISIHVPRMGDDGW